MECNNNISSLYKINKTFDNSNSLNLIELLNRIKQDGQVNLKILSLYQREVVNLTNSQIPFLGLMTIFSGKEKTVKFFNLLNQHPTINAEIFFYSGNNPTRFKVSDLFVGALLDYYRKHPVVFTFTTENQKSYQDRIFNELLKQHSENVFEAMYKQGNKVYQTAKNVKNFLGTNSFFNKEVYENLFDLMQKNSQQLQQGEAFAYYILTVNPNHFCVILQSGEFGGITYKKYQSLEDSNYLTQKQFDHFSEYLEILTCVNTINAPGRSSLVSYDAEKKVLSGVDLRFIVDKVDPKMFIQNFKMID